MCRIDSSHSRARSFALSQDDLVDVGICLRVTSGIQNIPFAVTITALP